MPEAAARTSILLVDDHTLFRESIARLLSREPDLDVVGHYARPDVFRLEVNESPQQVSNVSPDRPSH